VFKAVTVFLDVTSRSAIEVQRRFRGTCCFHHPRT